MRLSSASSSSPAQRKNGRSGLRLRKKHKKLDAICEKEYNRHHSELTRENVGGGAMGNDSELRRSSRARRAPVLLDASPPPPKRRRKLGKNVVARGLKDVKGSERAHQSSSGVETPETWGSRLRSRVKNASLVVKEDVESPRGKRKLFEVMDGSRDEKVEIIEIDKKEELGGGMPKIMKSKRPGRIKATKHAEGHKNNESHGNLNGNKSQEVELMLKEKEGNSSVIGTENFSGNVIEIEDETAPPAARNEGRNNNMESEDCNGSAELSHVEPLDKQVDRLESAKKGIDGSDKQVDELESAKEGIYVSDKQVDESESAKEGIDVSDKQVDESESAKEGIDGSDKEVVQLGSVKEGIDRSDLLGTVGVSTKEVENEIPLDKKDSHDAKTMDDANNMNREEPEQASNVPVQPRIKEGRRCGLCGGGTDGRPPKRFVQDNGESENEAYGSSASEEPNYDIWDGFGDEPGWLGRLLGPINDRYGIAGIWVHQHCAVWSPEVYFAGLGCLRNVRAALCRGRALKCTRCGRRGATIGCRVDRCPKTYHLPCARANGCIFDHRKFLIACTDHRHLFQPHGIKYLARLKKLKARKMKLEMRKLSNDAWRKDVEAEERWLENCGEDEEFLKRESKRLHRDLVRIAPIYVGGSDSNSDKSFQGWESVAGLNDVIQCMKEVVIMPLLYPEFFDNLGLTPPRGVLLHGYPGTGKTLVVRALIGACARGNKRIAYFARKGADCLGKYVGDAERQLRLLFQVAEKCQPSIIFFDEIDGLAPCRTRRQDQTHSSVVSTLLALMDGLKSRGSVVVIGATNRPDAVDPALRRPGRFDREIYFPLPSVEDRASILSLHTQRWPKPITGSLLEWIARKTPGFAGADLQALCTQAAMNALKRNCPLQEMLSAAGDRGSGCDRPLLPSFAVEERDWLEALLCSGPPCSRREAGIAANDVVCSPLPLHLVPCLLRPLCTLLVSLYLDEHLWLPPPISKAITMIKNVMISALDKKKMSVDHWWSHVDEFLQEANIASEVEQKLTCSGILFANDAFAGSHHPVHDIDDERRKFEPSEKHHGGTHGSVLPGMSSALTNKSGFRILIDGSPRAGQKHLASCLLSCFIGNLEIQKIDMATISQEGPGDVVHGIAQILMKCASMQSCIVFMPRIDLWAVEAQLQVDESTDSCSTNYKLLEMEESHFKQTQLVGKDSECTSEEKKSPEMAMGQPSRSASYAWMSFLEQVQSIGASASLMILATSEVPYHDLPFKIREFFGSDNSRLSQSTPLNPAVVSRFSLQIDRNFDHDAVINLSAAELVQNILEQLIQLIHQRSHVPTDSQKGYQTCDSIKDGRDIDCPREDNRSASENKSGIQLPESFTKFLPPPNNKSLKGKSTLLLAISNFGYQILRYPQFAELCWVTSKLRAGPSADVNGPWKGWPFNSCIIHPNNLQDRIAVSCTSGNIKSKERSGLVRGLIAVGLSAYKGAYTSVRQVSLEVRKVLEILVKQINTKVQAGKDRYQYIRVLSQVAYLEDMVNNWAYALQSLERDSPEHMAKTMPPSFESLDNLRNPCEDNQVHDENCQLKVPMEGNEQERLERSLEEIAAEASGCLAPNEQNGDLHNLDYVRVEFSEGSTLKHILSDRRIDNGTVASQPVNLLLHGNGMPSGLSEFGTAGNHGVVDGEFGTLDLNGSTNTNYIAISEDELHSTQEPESVKLRNNSNEVSDQVLSLSSAETGVKSSVINSGIDGNPRDINVSSSKGSDPTDTESGCICSYQFCPGCLCHLYHLMQKLLVQKLGVSNSHWTAEDVHDVVASLSVDLILAIRKFSLSRDLNDISDKNLSHEKHRTSLECSNLRMSNPSNSHSIVVPVGCDSHCTGQHATTSKDAALNGPPKLNLKFIFRDGVLVHMDPDKDASLHCKFENLCICSLGELIVKTKRPFG